MKSRKKSIIAVVLCLIMVCAFATGCGAEEKNGNGKISVNSLTGKMTLTNVTYYDYYNNVLVTDYSGKCVILSNTQNSTELWFTEGKTTRVASLSSALSSKPSTVKLYTNKNKTSYVTYECEY